MTVLNERYGLNISLVAFDKALYRLRKSTDEPSLADVDSVSAAETNFSEASGPDNGFFCPGMTSCEQKNLKEWLSHSEIALAGRKDSDFEF